MYKKKTNSFLLGLQKNLTPEATFSPRYQPPLPPPPPPPLFLGRLSPPSSACWRTSRSRTAPVFSKKCTVVFHPDRSALALSSASMISPRQAAPALPSRRLCDSCGSEEVANNAAPCRRAPATTSGRISPLQDSSAAGRWFYSSSRGKREEGGKTRRAFSRGATTETTAAAKAAQADHREERCSRLPGAQTAGSTGSPCKHIVRRLHGLPVTSAVALVLFGRPKTRDPNGQSTMNNQP